MKNIKIIAAVFSLLLTYSFLNAQSNCHGNKVRVYKGGVKCGCSCQKKCVSQEELQEYLNNGWNTYGCFNCCWVSTDENSNNLEVSIDAENLDIASNDSDILSSPVQESEMNIQILDMTGKYVTTVTPEFLEYEDSELIQEKIGLSSGIYFLKIEVGDAIEVRKISIAD